MVLSKILYFHPEPWGRFPFWLIFFKGVETLGWDCDSPSGEIPSWMPTVVDLLVGTLLLGPISVIFLADGTSSVRNLFQEFAALSPLCRIGLFAFWLCYKHLLGWVRLLAIADVTAPEDLTAIRRFGLCWDVFKVLPRPLVKASDGLKPCFAWWWKHLGAKLISGTRRRTIFILTCYALMKHRR